MHAQKKKISAIKIKSHALFCNFAIVLYMYIYSYREAVQSIGIPGLVDGTGSRTAISMAGCSCGDFG